MAGDHRRELSGFEPNTTNNRMEILAAVEALRALKYPCSVKLYSDSAYLINAFLQNWLVNWQRKGWINAKKDPVENQDLWRSLLEAVRPHRVEWIKVKGHSDNPHNNRCDELARAAITASKSPTQGG